MQIQTISNQLVMLASSNVEGASRMCNLQGDTHDLYEDEGLKIYLITITWKKKKKNQARKDCDPSVRQKLAELTPVSL